MSSTPTTGSISTPRPKLSFAKDVTYNLAGQLMPLLAGVFTVPVLLSELGLERMGVLAIAWLIVGYSGFLDLGLSRSITQITAELLSSGQKHSVSTLLWTALIFSGLLSIFGTTIAWALIGPLLKAIKISTELKDEVLLALRIFCFSIPPAILGTILLGFLSAYRRFGIINAIKIPTGVLMTAGPLLSIVMGSHSLVPVMGILVGARSLTFLSFAYGAWHVEKSIRTRPHFDKSSLGRMLKLGSWITITNVISPILVYCDRFFIGSILSVTSVAFYTTPQDTITKLLALPIAMVTVLFPYIASQYKIDPASCISKSQELLSQTFILLFPVISLVVIFAQHGMTFWLGAEFASHSYQLLQVFCLGVLINGLAQVPATILQGVGKPQWPAIIHLLELLLYVPISLLSIRHFGLLGAAMAWGCRIMFDAIALAWAVQKTFKIESFIRLRDLLPKLGLIASLVFYMIIDSIQFPIPFAIILMAVFLTFYFHPITALVKSAFGRSITCTS